MLTLGFLRPNERITAEKINVLIEAIKRTENVQAQQGSDIRVVNNSCGIFIGRQPRFITIDDKYRLDEPYNQSDLVKRLCDERLADIADVWRIRAVVAISLGGIYTVTGTDNLTDRQKYKLMWLINRFGEEEGGWLTDAAQAGLDLVKGDPALHQVATPIRRVGQIGDVLILCDDDLIAATEDGDIQCYTNIRHDAHHYKSPVLDGRIRFMGSCISTGIESPPAEAQEYQGAWKFAHIVNDPEKADLDTELKKESGQWRIVYALPLIIYTPTTPPWIPPPPPDVPPKARIITLDTIAGQVFPHIYGPGWRYKLRGSMQVSELPLQGDGTPYNLRLYFEYGAVGNVTDTTAKFKLTCKTANVGDDINTIPLPFPPLTIDFPCEKNVTESTIQMTYADIPCSCLSDNCLIIIEDFGRDVTLPGDDYIGEVVITSYKAGWVV